LKIGRSLKTGDEVMADKGFQIQDLLAPFGIHLNIQVPSHRCLLKDVLETRSICSLTNPCREQLGV